MVMEKRAKPKTAQDPKLWSWEGEFVILPEGEVQGYILRLGNGTGGHHERCS